jgi:hypothetical protein
MATPSRADDRGNLPGFKSAAWFAIVAPPKRRR